jgi:hypothetical protein
MKVIVLCALCINFIHKEAAIIHEGYSSLYTTTMHVERKLIL